jgi:hypothetical protein
MVRRPVGLRDYCGGETVIIVRRRVRVRKYGGGETGWVS